MIHKTTSSSETKKLAAVLAKKFSKKKSGRHALVFALTGDLGSGKTTFVQGFLRALGVKSKITSPTFVLIKNYSITQLPNYSRAYHIDCYRIKKPNELLKLGFKGILKNPRNIVLIEWAEKISAKGGPASGGKKILPKNSIWLKFEHGKKENERIIKVGKV